MISKVPLLSVFKNIGSLQDHIGVSKIHWKISENIGTFFLETSYQIGEPGRTFIPGNHIFERFVFANTVFQDLCL